MRHATLLAFPSYGPESLSRVLIEAAALGVPIAAMDTGGTRDIIQHRVTGLLSTDVGRLRARPGRARRGRAPPARARPRGATGRARALLGDVRRRTRGTGVSAVARARRRVMMTRPLSVAVVARAVMPLHGVGGLERSVHDLVRHLAARGVEVTLIVPPPVTCSGRRTPTRSPHRTSISATFPTCRSRSPIVVERRCWIAARRTCCTAGAPAAWRDSLANSGGVDLVHGFGASVLGASDGMMAPLVLNPQGLEEFGATADRCPR